ncbi:protein TIC 22, chloroplastic-like [Zingiber officinale]|uniref:protein TIC 22, chloroplastic-like n=1 Tax=Zingiber officinale TaxID=94328 RepID=UPI001C4D85BC|nr:protein TIC 22, chloroplastic-like [Zingiber officinale]XP_042377088.1 protein TIC 22, chloroplastic-like [Zingiber officinale]
MDSPSPSPLIHPNPLAAAASFLRHHVSRLGSELSSRVDQGRRFVLTAASPRLSLPPFAAASVGSAAAAAASPSQGKHSFDLALSADYVAKTLAGTAVYTVSNSNNEFVLISDPNNSFRSLGILCFRQEDAQTLLAQVKLRQPILGRGAKVVPITLDQVYMLKVEGIAFRFLPDPLQIKNALTLRSADISKGFDGVPVFQSDLLVVKKKNKRYCPIYFQKEDIERELLKASKPSRGSGLYQNIMVGSLEDVLKKMEMNDKDSGWDDLIFIPPGKSYTEHINEVAA